MNLISPIKISVIIPVYNVEKYIEKSFDSLCSQNSYDVEYIVVDDGSTDRSGQICDAYAARDSRFRVIHIPNQGVSHARNVGLDYISSENADNCYVMFVDPDDWLTSSNAISQLQNTLEHNKCDLLLYNYTINERPIANLVGGVTH